MELRQLRYLAALADAQNFTRAAEQVFISQSALSQQIQALEQEVGAVLVDRSRRCIRLTGAGEILVRHARRAFFELEQAEVALRELEDLQRGELHIGAVQTVNDYLIPSLAAAFARAHPRVKLIVEELPTHEIEARLAQADLQLGLGFLPAAHAGLKAEPLFEEPLALIVRRDHPLAGRPRIAVAQLDGLPVVLLSSTFCTRQLWEANAQLSGAQPNVVMEMNTVSSLLAVVERTGLATVLPKQTLTCRQGHELASVDLCDPQPVRQVGLLRYPGSYLCAASRAFIAMLHTSCGSASLAV